MACIYIGSICIINMNIAPGLKCSCIIIDHTTIAIEEGRTLFEFYIAREDLQLRAVIQFPEFKFSHAGEYLNI